LAWGGYLRFKKSAMDNSECMCSHTASIKIRSTSNISTTINPLSQEGAKIDRTPWYVVGTPLYTHCVEQPFGWAKPAPQGRSSFTLYHKKPQKSSNYFNLFIKRG
jgi:hypothetical protein